MKGENFFSGLPIDGRLAFLGAIVLIAVVWYFYRQRQQKKEPKESLGDIPLDSKRVFKLDDYEQDPFDKHRFISPVNPKLAVREIECKDHDVIIYAASWPHLFISEQLIELQKAISEITKVSNDSHQLAVTKSPAANFSDFQERLIRIMFVQLHGKYALRSFPQKAKVTPASVVFHRQPHQSISDQTLAITFNQFLVDKDFRRLMNNTSSYSVSFFEDYPQTVFLHKKIDYLWSRVEEDAIDFLTDYFSAGIDFKGEWSTIPQPPNSIEVSLSLKGKCELVLTFSGIHLHKRIEDLMKDGFWGIDSAHIHYVFDPKQSAVTIIFCQEIDFFQPLVTFPPILKKYDDKLNFNLKVVHPVAASKNSQPIPISFQINAFGQLAFFLPFDIDSMAIEKELLKIEGVAAVDFGYEIHTAQETRFVVSKKAEMTWSELFADVLSALVIVSPRTLTKQGEWPKDVVKVKTDGNSGGHDNIGPGNLDTYSACTL
ncbi:MAG: hypothetical protein WCW61_04575 [Patescibacteria group bacterium]|jgi:hypothetical protein